MRLGIAINVSHTSPEEWAQKLRNMGLSAVVFPCSYLINTFIQSLLGNEEAKKYMIDIYQALNMSTVGTLAYRSILNGGNSIRLPDFNIKEEREIWRNDNHSTDESISFSEDLLPSCRTGFVDVNDSVYQKVANKFNNTNITMGIHWDEAL